jgi:hypothetical protein
LHAYKLFWKPRGRNALCWAFYVVNDNTQEDGNILQVMGCMICHSEYVLFIEKTKLGKGIISYLKLTK